MTDINPYHPDQHPDNPYAYVNMNKLIQTFLKDVHNQDIDLEQIAARPLWKRVTYWWKALEKYAGKPFPEMTLEEIKSVYGD